MDGLAAVQEKLAGKMQSTSYNLPLTDGGLMWHGLSTIPNSQGQAPAITKRFSFHCGGCGN